ncbi:MAG: hypothetical protein ACOC5B_00635 [Myxococcota bacterium]
MFYATGGHHTVRGRHWARGTQFLAWLREHDLGRERLLDTLLAATYSANDLRSIVTSNGRDFEVFDCFQIVRSD